MSLKKKEKTLLKKTVLQTLNENILTTLPAVFLRKNFFAKSPSVTIIHNRTDRVEIAYDLSEIDDRQ